MNVDPKANYFSLPDNLPIPKDDGQAAHLLGKALPSISLTSTSCDLVFLDRLPDRTVIFIYPMTGVPGVALPEGWDEIPGARGCTPQACSYRDSYQEIRRYADAVFGLSNQGTKYQSEFRDRVHLPYHLLSDEKGEFQRALGLPTFKLHGVTYLKRLTLIIDSGVIIEIHYPVFPSNEDATWAIETLKGI